MEVIAQKTLQGNVVRMTKSAHMEMVLDAESLTSRLDKIELAVSKLGESIVYFENLKLKLMAGHNQELKIHSALIRQLISQKGSGGRVTPAEMEDLIKGLSTGKPMRTSEVEAVLNVSKPAAIKVMGKLAKSGGYRMIRRSGAAGCAIRKV